MRLSRKSPRIETAASRGKYRIHPVMDLSCQELDREVIPYDASDFTYNLLADMEWRPTNWLSTHYPELIFSFIPGKSPKPKGHSFRVSLNGGYRVADWRIS